MQQSCIIAINKDVNIPANIQDTLDDKADKYYPTKWAHYWIFDGTWDEYGSTFYFTNLFLQNLEEYNYGKLFYEEHGDITRTGDCDEYELSFTITLKHPKGKL